VDITAADIKSLREKTGAGMMDCKKALTEAKGDFAGAEKLLREWGMAGVEKRAGRATNQGRVFIKEDKSEAVMVEIACETDFVAKNKDFIASGDKIADLAFSKGYDAVVPELEAMVKDLALVIKENMSLKRVFLVKAASDEYIHSYMHGEGSLGVLVKIKSDKPAAFASDAVKAFVHDVALHVAAFNPMFLDQTKPGAAWIKEQEEIFQKQVELDEKLKSKPEKVIQGVLAGKLKKLMAEICLLDQGFVKDEKMSVSAAMAAVAKEAGCKLEIAQYVRAKVGEA
jgi:elongation factor Ts